MSTHAPRVHQGTATRQLLAHAVAASLPPISLPALPIEPNPPSRNFAASPLRGSLPERPLPNEPNRAHQNATQRTIPPAAKLDDDPNPPSHPHLTPLQSQALHLLLRGLSIPQAAAQLNVHRATLYRWRQNDDHFRAELARQQQFLWSHAADRLRALVDPAIDVLAAALSEPSSAQRAAATILRLTAPKRLDPQPAPEPA